MWNLYANVNVHTLPLYGYTGQLPPEKQGVIAAWNGKSCDMEWFFKTTDIIFAR